MPRMPSANRQPPRPAAERRERRPDLDRRVIEYLLRASARLDQPQDANRIAHAVNVPYSTATATLRRLTRSGRLVPGYAVNNFRTRYCHEYQVALALDGRAIASSDRGRRERLAKLPDAASLRSGGLVERFIEELLDGLASSREYRDNVIVYDAVLLHGAPGCDLELYVVTSDGSYSLGRWVRNELAENRCVRAIHTVTVGFRYSRNGYSGQHVNYQQAAASEKAPDAEA